VVEFRYTAPVFIAPEQTMFRYRLRGVDDRWIDAGTRREAYFTRLRPGAYDFEVVAGSHRGVWGKESASFAFFIKPFFFQTWWFYGLCGLVAASTVIAVVMWRIREVSKFHRLAQQAAIAEERSRIAKDLHDGLGADLTRLALLADLASGEPEEKAGEHLQKLSRSSREAARVLKEMIWIANPANDTLEGVVSRIGQTAQDFLGDARIRCRLDLPAQLPENPLTLDQRRNLLLVAREALNNIVKHASATEVCIRASSRGDGLFLEIEDNGRGFDAAGIHSDGLGLASMKRRIESLGGTLDLQSLPGAGTKISIALKIGQGGTNASAK
jgi:signal transduction histidine kinase